MGFAVAVCGLTGCAAHHQPGALVDRFTKQGEPVFQLPAPEASRSVEPYRSQVERLLKTARPEPHAPGPTSESADAELQAALAAVERAPTGERYRRAAEAYLRAGIADGALNQFNKAIQLNSRDAAALDGRARIWRDGGFPQLGLGDAYRAIAAAPASPVPQNTLGTLFAALGRWTDAARAFERALTLDPDASYAQANLCYVLAGDKQHLQAAGRGCHQ